jgi:FtsP/CotA-like multicopper oxidase with cupredoxin domain
MAPIIPDPLNKFQWEMLNPPDYSPNTAAYTGADYYELGLHEAWGFQGLASAGLFPDPAKAGSKIAVPNGMQWTGLKCNLAAGCACPADIDPASVFGAAYCSAAGKIPLGAPLFTPVWSVGQINQAGGPVTTTLTTLKLFTPGTASSWSANSYVATWPSISIRAKKGTPVVVKWVNEFPDSHVLCPHPEAADWPCAIDRTFMGVRSRIDPALVPAGGTVPPDGVNAFGSPQQPDNSWVTHLHGGEIPPSTDAFAEKWIGNANTAIAYNNIGQNFVQPPFENVSNIQLKRPAGVNSDVFTYPMVQEEALIWFHDHTLGKTHHNVVAGPAGFFPVKEPARHAAVTGWTPPTKAVAAAVPSGLPVGADYTWLDPVTELRDALGIPMYDLFLAIQDRSFNEDGSFNFSNGLGQTPPPTTGVGAVPIAGTAACAALGVGGICQTAGTTSVTAGVNPLVHPVWVPEYFGDHALVNGVLWPKKTVEPGWYRVRIVDGSDSRCYTLGLQAVAATVAGGVYTPGAGPAPGAAVTPNVTFYMIANDQGYLKNPVAATSFTMCPGERYEFLVNFGALAKLAANSAATVYLTNSAVAPFPVGVAPTAVGAFQDLNVVMRFDVMGGTAAIGTTPNPSITGIKSCTVPPAKGALPATALKLTWASAIPGAPTATELATNATKNPVGTGAYTNICMPSNPTFMTDLSFVDMHGAVPATAIVRQVYLNEKVDGTTLFPLGMQLNGVPFEYKVTETPKLGSREYWMFVNLTVDAHPMHPHLVRHQIVSRQNFSVPNYKTALCGATTCVPFTSPGGEMLVVPDVTSPNAAGKPYLTGTPTLMTAANVEGGFKDVTRVMPAQVTTIVADWVARWTPAATGVAPTAPSGAVGCAAGTGCGSAAGWTYEAVTAGPYVWHCHINSHEDSEMMRTSLVVP